MKIAKLYLLGLAVVMGFVLALPGQSARAQSMEDWERDFKRLVRELAERFHDMSAQWQESMRAYRKSGKDEPVSFILQHKDALELAPRQIEELKKLRSRLEKESIRRGADIKVARMELDELMEADSVDMEKAEEKVRELERLRADEKLSRIRTAAEAKSVLGPDQRKKLAVLEASDSFVN